MKNDLYKLEYDPNLKTVTIVPSEDFTSFPTEDQLDAIKCHIENLCEDLKQLEEMFTNYGVNKPEIIERGRELFLELELAQQYLVFSREHCRLPWTLGTENIFHPAPTQA